MKNNNNDSNKNNDSNLGKRGAGDDGDQDPSKIQRVDGGMVTPPEKIFKIGKVVAPPQLPEREIARPKIGDASAFKKQYDELIKLIERGEGDGLGGGASQTPDNRPLTPIHIQEDVTQDNRPVTPTIPQSPPESPRRTIVRNLDNRAERETTPISYDASEVNKKDNGNARS